MKFAIVEGERREALKGVAGECIGCSHPMTAKCGDKKVHHWAHKNGKPCDHWWESETEWHRSWKNYFPKEWQERVHHSDDGEKHIADVKTSQDWVIEFQHSPITDDERSSRNQFYKRIAWVVNGSRLKRTHSQFVKAIDLGHVLPTSPSVCSAFLLESSFLQYWANTNFPVFIDYVQDSRLWCLLPIHDEMYCYLVPFDRTYFLDLHLEGVTKCGHDFPDAIAKLCKLVDDYKSYQRQSARYPATYSSPRRSIGPLDHLARSRRRRL